MDFGGKQAISITGYNFQYIIKIDIKNNMYNTFSMYPMDSKFFSSLISTIAHL